MTMVSIKKAQDAAIGALPGLLAALAVASIDNLMPKYHLKMEIILL